MKKIIFVLLPFLFLSCSGGYWTGNWDTEITNTTNETVSFYFFKSEIITLKSQETYTAVINKENKPVFLNNSRLTFKESFSRGTKYYDIINLNPYNILFYNNTDSSVIVTELSGALGDTNDFELILPPQKITSCIIYTRSPKFIYLDSETKELLDKSSIIYLYF